MGLLMGVWVKYYLGEKMTQTAKLPRAYPNMGDSS